MDEAARKLAADSGVLHRIAGRRTSAGYAMLEFIFNRGTLRLTCDADTDEILVCVASEPTSDAEAVDDGHLASLLGGVIEQAWTMTNDRGYADAFQIRCVDLESRRENCVQFEVGAAAIAVTRVSV